MGYISKKVAAYGQFALFFLDFVDPPTNKMNFFTYKVLGIKTG